MDKAESNAINIARFILIIGVVFIHMPLRFSDDIIMYDTPLYNFISSRFFLMDISLPGLFLLSGYLFFYKLDKNGVYEMSDYFMKLKSRVKTIVVPYIFWNLFWLIYNLIKNLYLSQKGLEGIIIIDSIESFVSAFWAVGQGDLPNAPIAPYTWFLRDIFVFAILSPFYYWIYRHQRMSCCIFILFFILLGFPDFEIPLLNPTIFIGGFLAYNKYNLKKLCSDFNWISTLVAFLVVNFFYYNIIDIFLIRIGVLCLGFILLFKISLSLYNVAWINKVSKVSTYLYLVHIFVINMGMHFFFAVITPQNDMGLVICYLLNLATCLFVCFSSFYILKALRANTLLRIMTGDRF